MGQGGGGYKAAGGGGGGGGCRGLGRRGRGEKPVIASTASVQSDAEPVSNTGPVSKTSRCGASISILEALSELSRRRRASSLSE